MPHRDVELAELRRLLLSGISVQMLAPRRVGKTWLMHEIERELKALGWRTIFCDVEGMRSEDEFLRDLCKKIEETCSGGQRLWGQLTHRLQNLLGSDIEGNPLHAIGRLDGKRFLEALIASLDEQDVDTVIMVDEIALFVSALLAIDPRATADFLYHLRKLRQSYPKVRWLLTGSIGLDVVARRENLAGALVDLEIFALEPFTAIEARRYVDALSRNRQVRWPFILDDAGFAHLADQLGWLSPFYLSMIANRIRTDGTKPATIAEIDAAFGQLLAPTFRASFAAWEEHLKKNFPKAESEVLHAILSCCCVRTDGETAATLQAMLAPTIPDLKSRDIMDALTALAIDGFLFETGDRWQFRSGLLRRYWVKYICS